MKLAVFDFDNTLFRSPLKPADWKEGWWGDPRSLQPPFVPEIPGPEWWVQDVVNHAHRAISDTDCYTLLLTGRLKGRFKQRVNELLLHKGLRFDEVHLCYGGGTLAFKLARIKDTLDRIRIRYAELWDDRVPHLNGFEVLFQSEGVDFKIHHVTAGSAEEEREMV